jgi:magnesium-transporting ATPase (P-type)
VCLSETLNPLFSLSLSLSHFSIPHSTIAGASVPADIRLIEVRSSTLDVAEAMLTGESTNVGKNVKTLASVNVQLQDKRNMLFAGTNITRGKGVGVVVATGGATEKGKICDALSEEKDEDFPLKVELNELGNQLSKAVGVICLVGFFFLGVCVSSCSCVFHLHYNVYLLIHSCVHCVCCFAMFYSPPLPPSLPHPFPYLLPSPSLSIHSWYGQ